jgi:tRNA G18 (ribose-2'-O)-methylase SpoU
VSERIELRDAGPDARLEEALPAAAVAIAPFLRRYDDARDRELRGRDRRFVVEGERVVRRFLRSGFGCESVLATPERLDRLEPRLAERTDSPVRFVAEESLLSRIAGYRHHGGCLAIGIRPWHLPSAEALVDALPAAGPLLLVVALGVVQVDNIGSIFRSAACFAADAVLLDEDCADPLLRKPIRFSMGRVFDVPWGVARDAAGLLERLRARGVRTCALELADDAAPLDRGLAHERLALVAGSEANGIPEALRRACDATCAIPAAPPDEDGEARSLNVATATAIGLYEARRGRSR